MFLQVLEQLGNLDAKMTYSQARSAAVGELKNRRLTETLVYEHWHKKTVAHFEQQHLQQHPQPRQEQYQHQPQEQQETARPLLLHSPSTVSTASRRQWGGQHNASGRALSVAGSAAAHRDPEAAAAAAAGALSEMKQWAIDQELSMMEVCTYVPCVCMSLCMHFDHQIQEDLWVRMVLRSLLY